MWKSLRKDIDLEDPTPMINQVYAKVNQQAVQSKNELLKSLQTSAEIGEKI